MHCHMTYTIFRSLRRTFWCGIGLYALSGMSLALAQEGSDVPKGGERIIKDTPASTPADRKAADQGSDYGARQWASVPRVRGHLQAKDLGLIINTDDPYSVEVGNYYIKARRLAPEQVMRVKLPVNRPGLYMEEFADFSKKVDQFFGDRVQALALAWKMPFAVDCNSITGALAMGFDLGLCKQSCAASRPSKYFASASTQPYKDHKMRLSMLLAAPDVASAKAMIKRGVAADGTQGIAGEPMSNIYLLSTSDQARSVRRYLFPPAGKVPSLNVNVHVQEAESLKNASRVLIYQTGKVVVDDLDTVQFVPGALGDHLTSYGGALEQPHGQMTALSWIKAGATASYGTTSEPCAHVQKFPNPQAVILFYGQGATAIEAYWKSVEWPQQGLFIGEPLAAPFDLSKR
jgi:uncharacterized protein (TIGR03790 family)